MSNLLCFNDVSMSRNDLPPCRRFFNTRFIGSGELLTLSDWQDVIQQGYHPAIDGGLFRFGSSAAITTWIGENRTSQPGMPKEEGTLNLGRSSHGVPGSMGSHQNTHAPSASQSFQQEEGQSGMQSVNSERSSLSGNVSEKRSTGNFILPATSSTHGDPIIATSYSNSHMGLTLNPQAMPFLPAESSHDLTRNDTVRAAATCTTAEDSRITYSQS